MSKNRAGAERTEHFHLLALTKEEATYLGTHAKKSKVDKHFLAPRLVALHQTGRTQVFYPLRKLSSLLLIQSCLTSCNKDVDDFEND